MTSIADLFNLVADGQDFYISLGNFLDEFYGTDARSRFEMIRIEPVCSNIAQVQKAFLAATVHKLANDYSLPVPSWVFEREYYFLNTPYFDCDAQGKLHLLFMYKSPLEFKHRNLFVGENVLVRV